MEIFQPFSSPISSIKTGYRYYDYWQKQTSAPLPTHFRKKGGKVTFSAIQKLLSPQLKSNQDLNLQNILC